MASLGVSSYGLARMNLSQPVSCLTLATVLAFGLLACSESRRPALPFDGSATTAEQALRSFGSGVFEVVEFRVGGGEYKYLTDHFRFGSSLYDLQFEATLRYVDDLHIDERSEILNGFGRGEAIPVVERQLALLRLLGVGSRKRGETQVVQGSAVFEEVRAGWRLATVDRRWRLVPE